jgi:hypothetical protein
MNFSLNWYLFKLIIQLLIFLKYKFFIQLPAIDKILKKKKKKHVFSLAIWLV